MGKGTSNGVGTVMVIVFGEVLESKLLEGETGSG